MIIERKGFLASAFLLVLGLLLSFCASPSISNTSQPTSQSTAAVQPSSAPESQPTAGEISDYDELLSKLREAGKDAVEAGPAPQSFFSVPGSLIQLDGGELQVYEFPDSAARQAAAGSISRDGTRIGSSVIRWADQPHFYATGRLIILYVGRDEKLLQVLQQLAGEPLTQ